MMSQVPPAVSFARAFALAGAVAVPCSEVGGGLRGLRLHALIIIVIGSPSTERKVKSHANKVDRARQGTRERKLGRPTRLDGAALDE